MGCNKEEPYTVDHKRRTVYLCRTFAERLFFPADKYADKLKELKKGFEEKTNTPLKINGMRHKRITLEDGTVKLIKDEYFDKSNEEELALGRYSFMNEARNDKENAVTFKGAVTKFDKCEYLVSGKTFERDIEGNLMTGEDDTKPVWVKGS